MASYFASLSDLVSPDILDKVDQAEIDAIHHGAGRLDESTLLHGVRVLVQLVREQARAEAEAAYDEKHERLRRHYHDLERRTKEDSADYARSLMQQQQRAVMAHGYVSSMVSHYRRKGTKRVPLAELAAAVGISLEEWHEEPEPRPFNAATADQSGGGS